MSADMREAKENVLKMVKGYLEYCASYGMEYTLYEYCEPDIPMTEEAKAVIAQISDNVECVASALYLH